MFDGYFRSVHNKYSAALGSGITYYCYKVLLSRNPAILLWKSVNIKYSEAIVNARSYKAGKVGN